MKVNQMKLSTTPCLSQIVGGVPAVFSMPMIFDLQR